MDRRAVPFMPWRYGLFTLLTITMVPLAYRLPWYEAIMAGFDIAALAFFLTLPALFTNSVHDMRANACRNDGNRGLLLAITGVITLVILVAVTAELEQKAHPGHMAFALVIVTLMLAWMFSNMVYALHYAHLYYLQTDDGRDCGGANFPECAEPHYWDFVYFAFTLGMTFQTSDTAVTLTRWRRVVTVHCLAAFVFNLGVLAFTINSLAGVVS